MVAEDEDVSEYLNASNIDLIAEADNHPEESIEDVQNRQQQ